MVDISRNWKQIKPSISVKAKKDKKETQELKAVALDCEMVGTGYRGSVDVLARVSIVDEEEVVLMDTFVKTVVPISDFRYHITGINERDLMNGISFEDARHQVMSIIHNKILVGHSINNDLKCLKIDHRRELLRDTAYYKPLRINKLIHGLPSLKSLVKHWLHTDVQTGAHDSVEDARVTMRLYKIFKKDWEKRYAVTLREYKVLNNKPIDHIDKNNNMGTPIILNNEENKIKKNGNAYNSNNMVSNTQRINNTSYQTKGKPKNRKIHSSLISRRRKLAVMVSNSLAEKRRIMQNDRQCMNGKPRQENLSSKYKQSELEFDDESNTTFDQQKIQEELDMYKRLASNVCFKSGNLRNILPERVPTRRYRNFWS